MAIAASVFGHQAYEGDYLLVTNEDPSYLNTQMFFSEIVDRDTGELRKTMDQKIFGSLGYNWIVLFTVANCSHC